jgi:light-regulated signal transduction histidine kinase (bacteriophytochrome)
MTAWMLAVAMGSATFGILVSRAWSDRAHRRDRERAAREVAARAHDMRQPVQAIELYAAAIARRVETEDTRELIARLHLAVADLQDQLTDLACDATAPVSPEQVQASAASAHDGR